MTPQQRMKQKLESLNIPYIKIDCYGRQIVITVKGESTAKKWLSILSGFTHKTKIVETIIECKKNKNTFLLPSSYKGYLVAGTI